METLLLVIFIVLVISIYILIIIRRITKDDNKKIKKEKTDYLDRYYTMPMSKKEFDYIKSKSKKRK